MRAWCALLLLFHSLWPAWSSVAAAADTAPSPAGDLSDRVRSAPPAYLAPGTFVMGEDGLLEDPHDARHRVTLTRPYLLARTEVTVAEFAAFVQATGHVTLAEQLGRAGRGGVAAADTMATGAPAVFPWWRRPGRLQGPDWPVTLVSFLDAVAYANWRSRQDGLMPAYRFLGDLVIWDRHADGWRLPTEAEWEYAARCGGTCAVPPGDDPWSLGPVARARPSGLGLAGMVDGIMEWCWDGHRPYPVEPRVDPVVAVDAEGRRVVRGAGVARREWAGEDYVSDLLGFRLARRAPGAAGVDPVTGRTVAELRAIQAELAAATRARFAEDVVADSLRTAHRREHERMQAVSGAVAGIGLVTLLLGAAVAGTSSTDAIDPVQPEPAGVATGQTMAIAGGVMLGIGVIILAIAGPDAELSEAEARRRAREILQQRRLVSGDQAVGLVVRF